jgi:hypothetical protein
MRSHAHAFQHLQALGLYNNLQPHYADGRLKHLSHIDELMSDQQDYVGQRHLHAI